jgi:hypothetical protein
MSQIWWALLVSVLIVADSLGTLFLIEEIARVYYAN